MVKNLFSFSVLAYACQLVVICQTLDFSGKKPLEVHQINIIGFWKFEGKSTLRL